MKLERHEFLHILEVTLEEWYFSEKIKLSKYVHSIIVQLG